MKIDVKTIGTTLTLIVLLVLLLIGISTLLNQPFYKVLLVFSSTWVVLDIYEIVNEDDDEQESDRRDSF